MPQLPDSFRRRFGFYLLLLTLFSTQAAATWQLDESYMTPPQGLNERVYALGVDSGDRLIAGGLFTRAQGMGSRGLARFFPDGTRDPSFDIGSGVADGTYNYVTDLLVLPDDSVIIVGDFGGFNGTTRGNIVRVKADGTVDPDFAKGVAADAMIRHIEHSGDGGYIIGGNFSNYDGEARSRLAKLQADGSLDESFVFDHAFSTGEWVDQIEVFDDGAILAAGDFEAYDVLKFTTSGKIDSNFDYDDNFFDYIEATLVTSDGKILLGGTNGILYRRNADGSFDGNFDAAIPSYGSVYGLRELEDGKILVTGMFSTSGQINHYSNFLILNSDGTLETTILPSDFETSGWVGPSIIKDDTLIFAGQFASAYFNGSTNSYNRIARFNTNPPNNPPNAVYFDRNSITLVENDYLDRSFQLKIDETPVRPITVFLEVVESTPSGDPIEGFPNLPNQIPVPMDGPNHTEVSIRSDRDVPGYQGTRRVKHRIRSVLGDAAIGEPSEIEIILLDDEPHPDVRFAQSSMDVFEGQDPEAEGFAQASIFFDSDVNEYAPYRIEVEAAEPELADRIHLLSEYFSLNDNAPVDFEIDVEDHDDTLTGPLEVTLRIVPEMPEAAAYLGSPATMTLRILDNEVAGGIRFDRSTLRLVSGQEDVELQTLISGRLDWTGLIYEIEYDDPEWAGKANFHPDQEPIGSNAYVTNWASLQDGNDGILKSGTARVRIRTEPDQPELLGEPSVLELTLHDDQALDGWLILQYPESLDEVDILTRDDDRDGQNTLLEWFNETDPEDASSARTAQAELVRYPYLDQGDKDFLALRFYVGMSKPSHVAIVQTIDDLSADEWTAVWRSDEDPDFDAEQVVERPDNNDGWAIIRLPAPIAAQGFVRLSVKKATN
ncbi:MAG: hypothetical protein GVY36_18930 [Verrucomicrobia bacterium]|jgi:uncharacterized delta-60 repeat protein|nr:hypothetical protein [Verrucomicrobiota bacterium]